MLVVEGGNVDKVLVMLLTLVEMEKTKTSG